MELQTINEINPKAGEVIYCPVNKYHYLKLATGDIVCMDDKLHTSEQIVLRDTGNYRGWVLITPRDTAPLHTDTPADDTPKTWGEMTDAEAQDIAHEIRKHMDLNQNHWAGLIPISTRMLLTQIADAIKPEPVVEEVVMTGMEGSNGDFWFDSAGVGNYNDTHSITFTTKDGEPDCDSITMERINDQQN